MVIGTVEIIYLMYWNFNMTQLVAGWLFQMFRSIHGREIGVRIHISILFVLLTQAKCPDMLFLTFMLFYVPFISQGIETFA